VISVIQKRSAVIAIFVTLLFCTVSVSAMAQSDIDEHRDCAYCGMDRKAYGYSRMLIQYEDGSTVGICSLHCAVRELKKNPGRTVKAILVADRDTRMLIDAEQAVWVMGGNKRGVMTERPKWAFQTRAAADAFIAKYGGTIVSWKEALAAAQDEVARELR
jgi:copper chaperone NosL